MSLCDLEQMDLSTFLQLAVPAADEEEAHYDVEYWASSSTASWEFQDYHGDFPAFYWMPLEAEEIPFEESAWGTEEMFYVWVCPDASTVSELFFYDAGVVEGPEESSSGLSTPDEYFWRASFAWTEPAVWQTTAEIPECDVDVFNIPAHLPGLVECGGLATPEEFFFAAVAV